MTHKLKKGIWLTGAALIALSGASGAGAQTSDAASGAAAKTDSTVVVVTGFRKSYADAVRMKRQAAGITDSISSDGLGRFPDLNVGEAIQRLPGVQINREAGSRDATINLRGLPGTYARTTINGLPFAEPILDSSTPLGAFNADIFSAISINKSPSAADQSGGLSGNIDLQIAPALSRKDGGFFKIANEYDTLGKLNSPAVSIGYNKHITPDLAVFGVIAYKDEKFRRDSVNYPQYTLLNAATTPGYNALYGGYAGGVYFPSDIRQVVKFNEGKLFTAAGGVEYKPDDNLKLGLSGFITQRNLDKNYTDIIDIDMRNALSVITPTGAPFQLPDGNTYVNAYDFSNVNVYDSFRSEPMVEKTWSLNANAEWRDENWRLSGVVTSSQAENHGYQAQIDVRNLAKSGAGNGVSGSFFSGGADIGDMAFSMTPDPAVTDTAGPWTWVGGAGPTLQNAAGDQVIIAGSDGALRNTLNAAQGDIERFLHGGPFSSVQAGVQVQQLKFRSIGYRAGAGGVQSDNIDGNFLRQSDFIGDFAGGQAGDYLRDWQTVNFNYAVNALQPVTVPAGGMLTETGFLNDPTNGSFYANNFRNDSNVASVYAMGKFNTTLFGVGVRGNVGARYEQTRNTITSMDRDASGAFTTNVYRHNYHDLLPSLLAAADLSDKLVLRFAAYSTFVRPQPRNVNPTTQVSGGPSSYTVTLGNVDIRPYKANSYDLSLEWYNRPNGLIALDIYEKDVKDLVTAITDIAQLCPSDASAWGLGHLSLNGNVCQSDLAGNPTVSASGYYNNPNVLRVRGIEFTAQQNLDFLPGFWKNFGGEFNYSHTTISGHNPDGSDAILPGVSENNYNLIAYYETKRWGARLTYDYRDHYILSGGSTFAGGPSIVANRGQLDGSVSYTISDRYSVSLDMYNLTNAIRTQYQNTPLMPRANDFDGRTFTLSLRGTF
jgi:TonB-dependent receptor